MIPEWLPNIHPLVVHFPIALLAGAVVANFITFFISEKWWDETKSTILYVAGTLFAGITYYSGTLAADSVFLPTEAQSVLSEHADWAEYLLWFFVIYTLLRIAFHWFDLFEKKSFKIIALITALPGLFMVFETAEYGGKMVYGYRVGTGQLLQQEEAALSEVTDSTTTVPSSFITKENGGWTWEINSNSVSDLITNFHWVEGSLQALKPTITSSGNPLLQLQASGQANLFVTHQSYQNIQVDYYLNLDDLDGEIELIHHLQDADNYDFVSLNSDGIIRQGRIQNGERTIFEEGTYETDGLLFLRVVADETHFRGYINREMKVHGHGDAPESGAVGIKFVGSGSLLISKIEMTKL
ncbi:MAG: hypothetical protein JJ953_11990 [Gracilimonas sp.]|uniref:DUF2231 domain-containing protein n=1 Tax=Gracilimonas TaxID=649462 RepID=UPI001B27FE40|nr:DUF2231 domain-containing protein [Gracilimonas sp.]MBO6586819.1 hypothetical protein [Gracilimonas sp.]MBO6614693.1 hypothetical protein [Gracilimonas sp.]